MREDVEPAALAYARSKAKKLYFTFTSIDEILRQSGLDRKELWSLIRGPIDDVTAGWAYQRDETTADEFMEIRARNMKLANHLEAEVFDIAVKNMKLLKERKNKRGKPMALRPGDIRSLMWTVLLQRKLLDMNTVQRPLTPGSGAIDDSQEMKTIKAPVRLDMHEVARALSKDKSMMRLIEMNKGAGNEWTVDNGADRELLQRDEGQPGPIASDGDPNERRDGKDPGTPGAGSTSERKPVAEKRNIDSVTSSSELESRRPGGRPKRRASQATVDVEKAASPSQPRAETPHDSVGRDHGSDQSLRETGAGIDSDEERDDFGDDSFGDPLGDEYS